MAANKFNSFTMSTIIEVAGNRSPERCLRPATGAPEAEYARNPQSMTAA
jgi:hypothetical protein